MDILSNLQSQSNISQISEYSKYIISIIYKSQLDEKEQDKIMNESLDLWKKHVNYGFLKYRKSVSEKNEYAYLDWKDSYPGKGWFDDHRGQKYLDLLGGYGIYNVGRLHPKVVETVQHQLKKQALHSQELIDPLRPYCAKLLSMTMPYHEDNNRRLTKCFFTNSGTESVEACLKMAFLSTGRKTIIAVENAFHGKTLGSLACTSKEKFRKPFIGSLFNTIHVPLNDISFLKKVFEISEHTGELIAGMIIEPIQGEGGIYVASDEYLLEARYLCDKYESILIFDEVQSGMGRTGKWWACQYSNVLPDLMAVGKAFGGGVMPVGACIGNNMVWEKYEKNPFIITTTFGGNPLALSAAIATINVIEEEKLIENASVNGDYFIESLYKLKEKYPSILKDVRGRGLMIGIEFWLNEMGVEFTKNMFSRNILTAGTLSNAKVIRVEPSLTITKEDIDYALKIMDNVLGLIGKNKIICRL